MIPPFLITKATALLAPVAAKLASPWVKWGLIAAVLVCSNVWTWHHTTLQAEREKAEAIAAQVQIYEAQTAHIVASREDVLRQRNDTERQTNQKIIDLQKRLVAYERNAKKTNVPVPPDSVGMFNAISSLLPAQHDLSGSDSSTGKPHESPEARIEVTRLLLAYVRAYGDCAGQLRSLWDDYAALVKVVRVQYTIQKGDD